MKRRYTSIKWRNTHQLFLSCVCERQDCERNIAEYEGESPLITLVIIHSIYSLEVNMAGEFIEGTPGKDCDKKAGSWGRPMSDLEYIWFGNKDEKTYPEEACQPFYHVNA